MQCDTPDNFARISCLAFSNHAWLHIGDPCWRSPPSQGQPLSGFNEKKTWPFPFTWRLRGAGQLVQASVLKHGQFHAFYWNLLIRRVAPDTSLLFYHVVVSTFLDMFIVLFKDWIKIYENKYLWKRLILSQVWMNAWDQHLASTLNKQTNAGHSSIRWKPFTPSFARSHCGDGERMGKVKTRVEMGTART